MDLLPTHSFNCGWSSGTQKIDWWWRLSGGWLASLCGEKERCWVFCLALGREFVWLWEGRGAFSGQGLTLSGRGWNRGLPWEPNYPPSLFSVCFIPPVTPHVCYKLQMTNIQKRELDIFVFNNIFENIKINFKHPNNICFHLIKFQTFMTKILHIYIL